MANISYYLLTYHFPLTKLLENSSVQQWISNYPTNAVLTWSNKTYGIEMTVLKIHCAVTRQWLKLHLPKFHIFVPIPYLQDYLLYKNQVSHHFK